MLAQRSKLPLARLLFYAARVKLLFIGDVVGEPGRKAIKALVPRLRELHSLDLVVANGENSAGGSGITPHTAAELFEGGVDIITSGDHLWDQKEVLQLLESETRFVRPMNYPPGTPGSGVAMHPLPDGTQVAVVNAQGLTFMADLDSPFRVLQQALPAIRAQARVILVDFHAEATSEKIALARMLDGQVTAVIGTHTHVQTADEQIFPGGTAFLCDAGFTGSHESVLGREIEPVISRFLTNMPHRFPVAKARVFLQGALIEIDPASGKAISIARISEPLPNPASQP